MNDDNLVIITYNGEKMRVTPEVAAYLEENRKEAHNQRKKDKRHLADKPMVESYIEEYMQDKTNDFVDDILFTIEVEQLRKAIEKLPEKQKKRLVAYFFEELTYAEIADQENVDVMAVYRSIRSAIRKIKKLFE